MPVSRAVVAACPARNLTPRRRGRQAQAAQSASLSAAPAWVRKPSNVAGSVEHRLELRQPRELRIGQIGHAPGREDHLEPGELGRVALEGGSAHHLGIKLGHASDARAPALAEDLAVARRIVVEEGGLLPGHRLRFPLCCLGRWPS